MRWTEVEDALLKQLLTVEGLSADAAARKFKGRTREAILGRSWRLGMSGTKETPRWPKQSSAKRKSYRTNLGEKDLARLKKLVLSGRPWVDIGKKLGVSHWTAKKLADEMGLEKSIIRDHARPKADRDFVPLYQNVKPRRPGMSYDSLNEHYPGRKTTGTIGVTDLEKGQCKWPVGDPQQPGFSFCGDEQVRGTPYCSEHCEQSRAEVA